jgi:hypothetical protein
LPPPPSDQPQARTGRQERLLPSTHANDRRIALVDHGVELVDKIVSLRRHPTAAVKDAEEDARESEHRSPVFAVAASSPRVRRTLPHHREVSTPRLLLRPGYLHAAPLAPDPGVSLGNPLARGLGVGSTTSAPTVVIPKARPAAVQIADPLPSTPASGVPLAFLPTFPPQTSTFRHFPTLKRPSRKCFSRHKG